MLEALVIIISLGALEAILWVLGQNELRLEQKELLDVMAEQTELLEDIAVSLSIREQEEKGIEVVK